MIDSEKMNLFYDLTVDVFKYESSIVLKCIFKKANIKLEKLFIFHSNK